MMSYKDRFEDIYEQTDIRYTISAEVDGVKVYEEEFEYIEDLEQSISKVERSVIDEIDQLVVDDEARLIDKTIDELRENNWEEQDE